MQISDMYYNSPKMESGFVFSSV